VGKEVQELKEGQALVEVAREERKLGLQETVRQIQERRIDAFDDVDTCDVVDRVQFWFEVVDTRKIANRRKSCQAVSENSMVRLTI
jgi:hypothetical protein